MFKRTRDLFVEQLHKHSEPKGPFMNMYGSRLRSCMNVHEVVLWFFECSRHGHDVCALDAAIPSQVMFNAVRAVYPFERTPENVAAVRTIVLSVNETIISKLPLGDD